MPASETLKALRLLFFFKKRGLNVGKKIYVGNISFKATEDNLREFISKAGEVESIKIITDPHTGQPKGFGFIEMSS